MIDDFVRRPDNGPNGGEKPRNAAAGAMPDFSPPPVVKPGQASSADAQKFLTPQQVAAHDIDTEVDLTKGAGGDGKGRIDMKTSRKHWWNKLATWFSGLSRPKQVLAVLAALVVIGGSTAFGLSQTGKEAPKPVAVKKQAVVAPVPKPTTVASTLSGLQVDPAVNERPVTAVMVENSTDARPQSGLTDASVVFEAIAEGGITRFMAVYQDTAPDYIGPIRSSRPYYLDWAMGFDAAYAHVGGSPEALQDIKSWGVKDLDQSFNAKYYQRITARYAPHNVYTSIAQLNQLEAAKGYGKSNFTGFARKADTPSKAPNAKSIQLNISSALYKVNYTYDTASNSYLRNLAGSPHKDEKSGKQISPKVVVAMVIPYSIQSDHKHSTYGTIGSGQAYVFQDGSVTVGTWEKTARDKQITFKDAAGKPLGLDSGQTWLTMVNSSGSVTYTP